MNQWLITIAAVAGAVVAIIGVAKWWTGKGRENYDLKKKIGKLDNEIRKLQTERAAAFAAGNISAGNELIERIRRLCAERDDLRGRLSQD